MSKVKTILFRADSSSDIGTGHIMRDLVLAQKYAKEGAKIIFASCDLKGNINQKILNTGYQLVTLKSNSKKELKELIKKLHIDLLVIDHYKIDHKKEKYLKKKTGVKILAFDDTYKRHYCDILLNHNISAKKRKYKKLVPKWCQIKCGKKYTLLRQEFIEEKKKKYKKDRDIKRLFIAMGGADTANLNSKILKVLSKFQYIKVDLVTTSANQRLQELQKYSEKKSWINLHIDSSKVAKLMAQSDLAIITTSSIVHEVLYMELPFIAIKVVENQERMYRYLKKKKYHPLAKFSSKKLSKRLRGIL